MMTIWENVLTSLEYVQGPDVNVKLMNLSLRVGIVGNSLEVSKF